MAKSKPNKNELGKISKPRADEHLANRKIYVVEMIQSVKDAPAEYTKLYDAYWSAVDSNLASMEQATGLVKHIFSEGIPGQGEDVKVAIEGSNPGAWRVVKERIDGGAQLRKIEDYDLFAEVLDWTRCLNLGLYSQKVEQHIAERHRAATEARNDFQTKQLNEAIGDGEAALLLTTTQGVAVPEGISRFIVAPPELDAIRRWVRSMQEQLIREAQKERAAGSAQTPPQDGATTDSGLWTPD